MKAKRKHYSGAFKAKVGLEALIGIKTIGQIAREYQVHPTLATQWKGVIRDRLPELFEAPTAASADSERIIAQLHQKIGELTVDDAQARQIFRNLLDMPAEVEITEKEVCVEFHRRAHLPIVLASGLCDHTVQIPWWPNRRLRLTTYTGRSR